MMEFEEFTQYAADKIKEYLPEEYHTSKVSIQNIVKSNDLKLTVLCVMKEGSNIGPNVYLEYFYDHYHHETLTLDEIMADIAKTIVDHGREKVDTELLTDYDRIKDKIVPRLLNAKMNKDFLANKPYEAVEDLAAVYEIVLAESTYGTESVIITNTMMERYRISEHELFDQAIRNLHVMDDNTITNMEDIIREMLSVSDMDVNELEEYLSQPRTKMYVITNSRKMYGASVILNSEFMDRVSDTLKGDFYILPSSVHECICVPKTEDVRYQELEQMVQETNATQVAEEERLSDYVYEYNTENHRLYRCNREGMTERKDVASESTEDYGARSGREMEQRRIRHGH